jgi:hypothetical protein
MEATRSCISLAGEGIRRYVKKVYMSTKFTYGGMGIR